MSPKTQWLQVFKQTLKDQGRSWLWWAIGLAVYVISLLAFYPSIKGDPSVAEMMNKLPESMKVLFGTDLTSPAGYIGGKILSLMPVLLGLYAALLGAGLIAGQESRGLLEFPLAQPLSRRELLIGRSLALLALLLGLGFVLLLSTYLGGQLFQAPLDLRPVAQTTMFHTLGAWVFGALALALGAASGKAGLASGLGGGAAIGLMVLYSLSGQISALKDWSWLNPWSYALGGSPLTQAVSLTPLLVCLLVGIAICLVAVPFFEKRDFGR